MKNIRGFTLVELMAAIAILALLTAAAIPSMRTFVANAHIRGTAEDMRAGLDFARSESIRRNAVVSFVLNGNGWNVIVPGGNADGTDLTVLTRPPKQTSISVSADVAQIQFAGSGWTSPFGAAMTLRITDSSAGDCRPSGPVKCLTVVAGAGGLNRSCDPAAASGSATACN